LCDRLATETEERYIPWRREDHNSGESETVGMNFTAVIQKDGDWWIGWVTEVPGVNSQGETREELLANLHSALEEALELRDQASCP